MRNDLTSEWFGDGMDPATYDPVRSARGAMASKLPKRFYKEVSIEAREGGFALLLDGKPARTKGRNFIALPNAASAEIVRAEWAAQGEFIDPSTMPATRMVHAALDHVATKMNEVAADIVKYAGSDLVCYRADTPVELVAQQEAAWNPVLDHMRGIYSARFILQTGIQFVEQPASSIAAIAARVAHERDAVALSALHVMTTIAGSSLIAIMVADGALGPEAGYAAGEVDAIYETEIWGADEEAAARFAARKADFIAAAMLYFAVKAG